MDQLRTRLVLSPRMCLRPGQRGVWRDAYYHFGGTTYIAVEHDRHGGHTHGQWLAAGLLLTPLPRLPSLAVVLSANQTRTNRSQLIDAPHHFASPPPGPRPSLPYSSSSDWAGLGWTSDLQTGRNMHYSSAKRQTLSRVLVGA